MSAPRSRRRRGFSLAELVVALALAGAVTAVATAIAASQQRLYRSAVARAVAGSRLRDASALLVADLRNASPGSGELLSAEADRVRVRAVIGVGIVCGAPSAAPASVALLPLDDSAPRATRWRSDPAPGDSVALIGPPASADTSGVPTFAIVAAAVAPARCPRDPLVTAGLAGRPSPLVAVATWGTTPPPASGTVARLTRPVEWSLYQGGDGLWYLGRDEYVGGRWAGRQPAAGPYLRARGATFRYFGADGGELAPPVGSPRLVRRVDVVLRADAPRVSLARAVGGVDSLVLRVFARNP